MVIYISGPMTGYSDFNRSAFHEAEDELLAKGFDVINPAKNHLGSDATWEDYMRYDIKQLMDAEAIYLLKGWERSRGARLEYNLACKLGMRLFIQE